ncbi:MAG: hypothetical protein QG566_176, partial [Patescibacteria group bacterium]|nr:hypothetical protein [Patescibacteria group bacterium]
MEIEEINEKKVSPTLQAGIKNFLIDIDGTISEDIPNEEPERMPGAYVIDGAVEWVNGLIDKGHIVSFFTSRLEEHREVTEKWLKDNGFKYNGVIVFGKPRGGNYHWVD